MRENLLKRTRDDAELAKPRVLFPARSVAASAWFTWKPSGWLEIYLWSLPALFLINYFSICLCRCRFAVLATRVTMSHMDCCSGHLPWVLQPTGQSFLKLKSYRVPALLNTPPGFPGLLGQSRDPCTRCAHPARHSSLIQLCRLAVSSHCAGDTSPRHWEP